MNTLKFNTFANSPKSLSPYPSHLPTQQSFSPKQPQNPFTSIPQLKKQMQQAINSRRTTSGRRKIHNKYPTQISLMKNDISLLSTNSVQWDLPLTMLELQVGFTEELLALRQDKITLMEKYNKAVDDRYFVQRQLTKLKKQKETKQRQSSQINQLTVFQKQNSSSKKKADTEQIILKNEKLKSQYQQLQGQRVSILTGKDEEQDILNQIQRLQDSSRIIEQKISKIDDNKRPDQQKRFETFFPGNKNPSKGSKVPAAQLEKIKKLRQQRDILLRHLADWVPNYELRTYFMNLIDENRDLHQKNDKVAFSTQTNIPIGNSALERLRQMVQDEQQGKLRFFEDLRRFKEQALRFRKENQQMRQKLRY